ncbi:hypothetical protein Tco_0606310 [Tanacetum coccineum]
MSGIFSIEARDMDMKLLSALESNNTLAKASLVWSGINIIAMLAALCFQSSSNTVSNKFLRQAESMAGWFSYVDILLGGILSTLDNT